MNKFVVTFSPMLCKVSTLSDPGDYIILMPPNKGRRVWLPNVPHLYASDIDTAYRYAKTIEYACGLCEQLTYFPDIRSKDWVIMD